MFEWFFAVNTSFTNGCLLYLLFDHIYDGWILRCKIHEERERTTGVISDVEKLRKELEEMRREMKLFAKKESYYRI